MSASVAAFADIRPALSLWAPSYTVAPPSSAVVASVLAFGDVSEWRDDGTTLIRFSPERIERQDVCMLLGPDRERALDISIVWDEREEQIVQVIDTAPLRPPEPPANSYAAARMRRAPRLALDQACEQARAA